MKSQLNTDKAELNQTEELSFLDYTAGEAQEKVLLTSFPRSGNTLIRTYLEQLTSIPTGSDCDIRRPLNRQLKEMGLSGEGKIDNSVWIVKSHYPERIGVDRFFANKVVVIVRNPLDSIFSLFNMVGTVSHN